MPEDHLDIVGRERFGRCDWTATSNEYVRAICCLRGRSVCATTLAANGALISAIPQNLVIIIIFQLIERGRSNMKHSPGFDQLCSEARARVREISVEEVKRKLDEGESFYFIDVREDHEWEKDHAAGATHLGRGIIERDIEVQISDHDAEIVLYCGGGYRSALSADNLQKMGYRNVLSMAGGIRAWREADYPLES